MPRILQLSSEGNLPLRLNNRPSPNSTTSNTLSNTARANLGLGGLSLELNQ
jgi:hypothetical protein